MKEVVLSPVRHHSRGRLRRQSRLSQTETLRIMQYRERFLRSKYGVLIGCKIDLDLGGRKKVRNRVLFICEVILTPGAMLRNMRETREKHGETWEEA